VATLTIRDLDDDLRVRLRVRAAERGRSMETEVREILRDALTRPVSQDPLGSRIDLPARTDLPRAATLP
jgi:antitoxin FitA